MSKAKQEHEDRATIAGLVNEGKYHEARDFAYGKYTTGEAELSIVVSMYDLLVRMMIEMTRNLEKDVEG